MAGAGLRPRRTERLPVHGAWGTPQDPRNLNQLFDRVRCAIGLDAHTFNGLRHDFASLLVGAGVPNRAVMEMMGRTNISMTSRYQHLADAL